jgi:hypothetical protein
MANEELAEGVGVGLDTLIAYLDPESSKKHRKMPGSRPIGFAPHPGRAQTKNKIAPYS